MTTSLKCRLEKSLLVPFIAAALLTTSAFNGNAQSTNKALIGDTEVTISFKGMEGNLLLLLVQFENPQEDRYLVQIQAQNNDSEYKEVYKGPVRTTARRAKPVAPEPFAAEEEEPEEDRSN